MSNNLLTSENVGSLDLNAINLKQIKIPSDDKYREILNDMVIAFHQQRKGCETIRSTEDYCKGVLKTCLTGFHAGGRIWKSAPGKHKEDWFEILKMRLRVFKYDIVNKRLIPGREKTTSQKIKEMGRPDSKADKAPINTSGSLDRTFTASEMDDFKKFKERFMADFQSSITIVDDMMMERLAFLMILSKRDIQYVELSKDLTKEIKELAESLGVAGKQRISAMNLERSGTLEQLSTKFKRTLEEHVEVETSLRLEELKMISNAVHRGTTPEFLAMSWVKNLYGGTIEGEELNLENLDKFLKKNNIDVRRETV